MNAVRSAWLLGIVVLLFALTGVARGQDSPPELTFIPVEGAVCGRGTPYQFAVRRGAPSRLLIFFQGGGACWNTFTCRPGNSTFIEEVSPAWLIAREQGALSPDPRISPLAEYTLVLVGYCTGDVHMGAADVTYTLGDQRFTIAHQGARNALAVLDWTFQHYPDPEHLVIAGSSAGAYGALYHAARILDHYRGVPALVFADAGVGVATPIQGGLDIWGVETLLYIDLPPGGVPSGGDVSLLDLLYSVTAAAFPDVTFAEYTTERDTIQSGFYRLQLAFDDWSQAMRRHITRRAALPNYRFYIAPGETHSILPSPAFATLEVGGVRLRDWLTALLDGERPASVSPTR